MAVPVPVNILMAPPPVGWTATEPNRFQKLVQLIASLLSGTIEASFLTGQVGGAAPGSNIGPWATHAADINANEWWFWDPSTGAYQPSQQGCPVGSIAMWPSRSAVPPRWLLCGHQDIPIASYPRLYNAIGTTWGSGGAGLFRLPPGEVIYFNGVDFSPVVPITKNRSPDGVVNITGGQQTETLVANQLPACHISIPYVTSRLTPGNASLPNVQSTAPGGPSYAYPVEGELYVSPADQWVYGSGPVGTNQQPIPTMPPFVAIYHIIKYL